MHRIPPPLDAQVVHTLLSRECPFSAAGDDEFALQLKRLSDALPAVAAALWEVGDAAHAGSTCAQSRVG